MAWKQAAQKTTTIRAKANARTLRRSLTDTEKMLWGHLRGGFAGPDTHFCRQVPLGAYIADFCCLKHRLIVELDGPIHDAASARTYDKAREQALQAFGYRVLRFTNAEATLDFAAVLGRIAEELAISTPTPDPSPQGGGECWRAS